MTLGIVGAEAVKFSRAGQQRARAAIRELITSMGASRVVSGRSPLGGIDIWAIEEARQLGVLTEEYPPAAWGWHAFRARNLQIVDASDAVVCLPVTHYIVGYQYERFPVCYHCVRAGESGEDHVKSGGCWTMHQARIARKLWGRVDIEP
jgi:PIN domain nuclease of toxin-antitoxin system